MAKRANWSITYTGSNHLRWRSPEGRIVFTPKTTHGGGHTVKNLISRLRHAGLDI